jgi:hypothetical protein
MSKRKEAREVSLENGLVNIWMAERQAEASAKVHSYFNKRKRFLMAYYLRLNN